MNERINVEVSADTFGTHTHQIFCGLYMLQRRGLINLRYIKPPTWMTKRSTRQFIFLKANNLGDVKLHVYDLNDSSDLANTEALPHIDYYHKRSYSKHGYETMPDYQKIKPLGFNYQIQAGSFIDF